MYKKLALFFATVSTTFAMHTAELNINQEDLEAGINFDIGQFNTRIEPDTTFIGVSYLKVDDEIEISNKKYETNDYLDLNFMIKQKISSTNFKVGLGIKAVYISSYQTLDSFISFPIGAEVSYRLPINSAIPINVKALGNYAPKSLSFSDAESFFEFRTEVHAELMNRASVYAGYRNIDTNYENGTDINYNQSVYFGVEFSF